MRPLPLITALCLLAAAPAFAAPPAPEVIESDEGIEAQSFLTLSHHGYFRLRSDLFSNLPMVVGTSGGGRATVQRYADGGPIMGANMRMRWQPQLAIGQRLRIGTTIDVMDNVVLGSSDAYAELDPSAPLVFLDDSQTDAADAIRIKELWGEWDIAGTLLLRFGRMSNQFGLGMVDNAGSCIDCDYGDYVDRVSALIKAFGFHANFYFDAPGDGYLVQLPGHSFGQPTDASTSDDVVRWGFDLGFVPMDKAARAQRRKDLGSGEVVVDAVLRNTFTTQNLDSSTPTGQPSCAGDDPENPSFDCLELRAKQADVWVGDLFVELKWRPSFDMLFRASLEVAGMAGDVAFVQNRPVEGFTDSAKEFLSIGGVLQLELEHRKLTWGLELGVASGDDVAFGPNGRSFNVEEDGDYSSSSELSGNKTVGAFMFDRDYHVDLLLYREAIGAVTNTFYVKPSLRALLFESGEDTIGAEISLLYGHALVPDSVPGREAPLGFETDVKVFYEATGIGRAELAAGALIPLAGLDINAGDSITPAFALQARINMSF